MNSMTRLEKPMPDIHTGDLVYYMTQKLRVIVEVDDYAVMLENGIVTTKDCMRKIEE